MPPEILTAQQVQERNGLSRSTLLRYEDEGTLRNIVSRTPGGQRRYNAAGIQRIFQNQTTQQQRPVFSELGDTGLSRWGGSVAQDDLTELTGTQGWKLYREMRKNDPVIAAVFFAIEQSLKQASVRVKPASEKSADKDVAEFVDQARTDMSMSWSETMDFTTQMLEMGVSFLHPVYKRRLGAYPSPYTDGPAESEHNDGRIGWRKWAPRPVDSLASGREFVFDDAGGIQGINQSASNGEPIMIPIERLLMFRTTAAPYNSPLGMPIHRTAYLPYYYTKNFQEIEGIGVERDLNGIPVVYLGNDCTLSGENSDYALAKDLVTNIRWDEQVGVVIPHARMGDAGEGQGMILELLSTRGTRAHDISGIIERYDKRKALSVLAQFIMLGMDKFGSFALSRTQNDLFVLAISAWLQKIADVINMYAIPRLLRYNVFPKRTGYPKMIFSEVGIPDLLQISNFVNSLVQREVLKPDDELERHLRQIARLPEPEPVEVTTQVKPRPLMETALVIRRIILALKELPTFESMADEQLQALIEPLIEQLRLGVEETTGQQIEFPTMPSQPTTQQAKPALEPAAQQELQSTVQRVMTESK